MTGPELDRKLRGAWYTPDHLVEQVVGAVVDADFVRARYGRRLRVLDPACGDGRFLLAVGHAVRGLGGSVELVGVDIDPRVVASIDSDSGITAICADALDGELAFGAGDASSATDRAAVFDLVIGNPPYLSQMASATTRGGSSTHGGGPYADAAAEFLALGASQVDPDGGRLAYVLPQSILSARDADDVRRRIDERADMFWSAWTGERDFDAHVVTCAVAFEFRRPPDGSDDRGHAGRDGMRDGRAPGNWSHVVTDRSGVPAMPDVFEQRDPAAGRLGDRARLNANFRDEYYGMIPAVGDHAVGAPLITSGLIDPGVCRWGVRPVKFAKQHFDAPRLDIDRLDAKMVRWAQQRLVPKVLVANQTAIIEAVCDPTGEWLPGVPVVAAYPTGAMSDSRPRNVHSGLQLDLDLQLGTGSERDSFADRDLGLERDPVDVAWEIAAVLTAPSVSVWAWHQRGGSGLSSGTIRVGPTMLADLVWPTGPLHAAVAALRAGDIVECGALVDIAYGLDARQRSTCMAWWRPLLDKVTQRP